MKYINVLLLFVCFLSACSSGTAIDGRAPNQFEIAYHDFALKLEDSSFCYKIYTKAYSAAGFNPKGYQISYKRSSCLYDLALKTKNPYFCNDVVSLSTALLDGSKISKENCIKEAEQGRRAETSFSFNKTLLMTAMGYSEDMWPDEVKREFQEFVSIGSDESRARDLAWDSFYLSEIYKNKNDFQNMASKLPAFIE